MQIINHIEKNRLGIHARIAAQLAQCATNFKSIILIKANGKVGYGSNVLEILNLRIKKGDELQIEIEGDDELLAAESIRQILNEQNQEKEVALLHIAFFGYHSYDKIFFDELANEKGEGTYNVELQYIKVNLSLETAYLAKGKDAVCIFVNDECGKEVVEKLHEYGIKLILLRCAGFNNVDLQACKEYGITVLRVPAYSPYAVAEHAMAIIQQANRRLHKSYNKVRENNFALSGLLGVDLHNKIAGIMGTGKIGICMANICKGYGMRVLGWDAYPNKKLEEDGLLTYVSKEELLAKADLISLHAPLVQGENGTYHLIDEKAIALMKNGVMLVNTSRGGLIDNEALIAGLKQEKFQAVALDVYEGENDNVYTNHSDDILSNDITGRLLMFPNVVITSHQAFFTREAMQAIAIITMENARNFSEGLDYCGAQVEA